MASVVLILAAAVLGLVLVGAVARVWSDRQRDQAADVVFRLPRPRRVAYVCRACHRGVDRDDLSVMFLAAGYQVCRPCAHPEVDA